MTTSQKIIKYLALSLAALLIITIFSSIVLALNIFSGVLGLNNPDSDKNMQIVDIQNTDIKIINIDIASTKLEFRNSNEFKIEVNNDRLKIFEKGNKLEIEEQNHFFLNMFNDSKLIIYLPVSKHIEEISIASGVGSVKAQLVYTDKFELDIGAGNVEIDGLYVTERSDISGGVGSLFINNGRINDLNLETGIGTSKIHSILTGNNDIEMGIGSLDVNLLTELDNYDIRIDEGIGSVKLNDQKITNAVYGNGQSKLNIEAGIGSIEILTAN